MDSRLSVKPHHCNGCHNPETWPFDAGIEIDREEVLDIMKTWNIKKLDTPLAERELENTVKSAYRNVQDGKRYGCAAFIDLGICVKGCPIRKK